MAAKNYSEMEKDEKILYQVRVLSRQLTKVDSKKKKIAESLMRRVAYYTVCLEELECKIDEEGYKTKHVTEYKNGSQDVSYRQNPNVQTHIAMSKNLTAMTKQLTDLCPEVEIAQRTSRLDLFRKGKLGA